MSDMKCDFTYILDGHSVVPCPDPITWARWHALHQHDRTLKVTKLDFPKWEKVTISTIFWGMDMFAAGDDRPPRCFESLIFGGNLDGVGRKYDTWDQALDGHDHLVEEARRHSY